MSYVEAVLYSSPLFPSLSLPSSPLFLQLSCTLSSTLRVSRSAKLSSLGSKGQSNASNLGKAGKELFEFSDLPRGVRIEFVGSSAQGRGQENEAEINRITTWLDQHC